MYVFTTHKARALTADMWMDNWRDWRGWGIDNSNLEISDPEQWFDTSSYKQKLLPFGSCLENYIKWTHFLVVRPFFFFLKHLLSLSLAISVWQQWTDSIVFKSCPDSSSSWHSKRTFWKICTVSILLTYLQSPTLLIENFITVCLTFD